MCDQALYAKVTEIVWKHSLQSVVPMMGNFHTVCNFTSSIGKLFGDAGLRDLAVESDVIAEGSVNKILEGKHYNRAVRLHKLVYEALMRLVWKSFVDYLKDTQCGDDTMMLRNYRDNLYKLHGSSSHQTLEKALQDESYLKVMQMFTDYKDNLSTNKGPLAAFWMTYIDMVELLLDLIRADREGDWQLHLASIQGVIPWCFAMDKTNYAR